MTIFLIVVILVISAFVAGALVQKNNQIFK